MASQPLSQIVRSASLALRRAELAKDAGDEKERRTYLEKFLTLVDETL